MEASVSLGRRTFGRRLLFGLALVLGLVAATAVEGHPPDSPLVPGQPLAEVVKPGDHWIGLGCRPIGDDVLRKQLGLPEGQGLVVASVSPDSPGAAAGIEPHDMLVKAGGKPVGKLQDLIDAVQAAKETTLALVVVRAGKEIELEVKPEKRPESQRGLGRVGVGPDGLLFNFNPDTGASDTFRASPSIGFRVLHPGTIFPRGVFPYDGKWRDKRQVSLPDDSRITITKEKDSPAKIGVRRGELTWEGTEENLDELSDEQMRAAVERALSGLRPRGIRVQPRVDSFPRGVPHATHEEPRKRAEPEGEVQKQLEEMNRRIDELHKMMKKADEVQSPQKEPAKPAKPAKPGRTL